MLLTRLLSSIAQARNGTFGLSELRAFLEAVRYPGTVIWMIGRPSPPVYLCECTPLPPVVTAGKHASKVAPTIVRNVLPGHILHSGD